MPSIYDPLRARWLESYDANPRLAPAKKHFDAVLSTLTSLETKRAELAKDANLSPVGRAAKAKEFAAKEIVPVIARAVNAIAANERHLDARRKALLPSVKDPTNVAAALLRSEMRQYVIKNPGALMAENVDVRLLEAIVEVPMEMTGLDEDRYNRTMELFVARVHGANAAVIGEETEALDLLRVATKMASDAARKEVMPDVADARVFRQWADEAATAAGVKTDDGDAEIAALSVAAVKEDARKLPLAERLALVDALLVQNRADLAAA
jgi:hypothetical protein